MRTAWCGSMNFTRQCCRCPAVDSHNAIAGSLLYLLLAKLIKLRIKEIQNITFCQNNGIQYGRTKQGLAFCTIWAHCFTGPPCAATFATAVSTPLLYSLICITCNFP